MIDKYKIEGIAQRLLVARQVFLMGNGGSAATAGHIANDFHAAGINATSLCDNIALITSIANDKSYGDIFIEQLRLKMNDRDVVIGISGSGESENVIRATAFANTKGAVTIGLLGFDGGRLKGIVKDYVLVPSDNYGAIESKHLLILHTVADTIKERKNGSKAVFVDRDGTIAPDIKYCSREEDFCLFPWTGDAVRMLNRHGYKVIVITNQSGIARGYFTVETLNKIHQKMVGELAKDSAYVDAIYYCPHHPDDNCGCRKPRPKLVYQATKEHNINLANSFIIGDLEMDAELGKNLGVRTILVDKSKNLLDAVKEIINP